MAVQTLYTCICLFTEPASRKMRVVAHPGISSQDTCTTHHIAVLLGKAGPIQAWRLPSNTLYASLQHSHARQPNSPPVCACTREPVWLSGKALGW